eukprot:651185_1
MGMGHDMDHTGHNMHKLCGFMESTYITVWFGVDLFILLSAIPLVCKFIYHQCKNKEKQPRSLLATGFLFVLVTMFLLTSDLATVYFYHCNHHLWMLCMMIFGVFYTIQIMLVLLILFLRVYFTFKSSPYQVSIGTVRCYVILFIASPIIVGCAEFWYHLSQHSETASIALSLCYAFVVCIMASLLSLFTRKLQRLSQRSSAPVNQRDSNQPQMEISVTKSHTSSTARHRSLFRQNSRRTPSDLKRVISRAVLLTGMSIVCTLSAGVALVVVDQGTTYGPMISSLLVVVDIILTLCVSYCRMHVFEGFIGNYVVPSITDLGTFGPLLN